MLYEIQIRDAPSIGHDCWRSCTTLLALAMLDQVSVCQAVQVIDLTYVRHDNKVTIEQADDMIAQAIDIRLLIGCQ
ncbi:hypothetical protein [Pseudoxanthomonas sp. UTMC 1351]|uniref:hypothetical protein n=1 Tax=Pseudoxanthomonas sp. UTMC 1351 TaxID=2695853 RepID=UPI0034CDF0B1